MKTALNIALKGLKVDDEVLATAVAEVVNTVNNSPLSGYDEEKRSLTPNDILLGGPNLTQFDIEDSHVNVARKTWKSAQIIADHFWKRWVLEVRNLRKRPTKWFNNRGAVQFQLNDVVLILDEQTKRNHWAKGIIQAVHPGRDGLIRAVTLRTNNGEMKRPAHKLNLLERPAAAKNVTETQ